VTDQRKPERTRASRLPADAGRETAAAGRRQRERLQLGALNERLGYFIRRFQVWIFQDFMRTLAAVDIRPAQYSVLTLIASNPGRSQADIGEALGIERARLVRMLDALEGRGLIQRVPSSSDRRSHCLFLTADGHGALSRIELLAAQHETHVADRIGPAQRRLLLKLLRDFAEPP